MFIVTPIRIRLRNVVDIGAVRACTISAFRTKKGKVFFCGFSNGHLTPDPVATEFTSMVELFASLDSPAMLEPLEVDVKQTRMEKLRLNFDDKVSHNYSEWRFVEHDKILNKCVLTQETADVTFSVDGKLIYAHKMILKLFSDHFRRMFGNDWKDNSQYKNYTILGVACKIPFTGKQ